MSASENKNPRSKEERGEKKALFSLCHKVICYISGPNLYIKIKFFGFCIWKYTNFMKFGNKNRKMLI